MALQQGTDSKLYRESTEAERDRICKHCGQRFGKHRGGMPERGDSWFACPPHNPFPRGQGIPTIERYWASSETVFEDLNP